MHTDETLRLMDGVTKSLGDAIRAFESNVCPAFITKELKREAQGRQRREARARSQREGTGSTATVITRRPKTLNLRTYKFHALGDYTTSIRMFGTTDSYSTQSVSSKYFHQLCSECSTLVRVNGSTESGREDMLAQAEKSLSVN